MGYKPFTTPGTGIVFSADERNIRLPCENRAAFWDWCEENKIPVEYQGTWFGLDLWCVPDDEKSRAWLLLRWA